MNFWNNLDKHLELEMDVIDDCIAETKEISAMNPWLNYSEPLHKLREFGATLREMDLIDEKLLGKEQMKLMLTYL